MSLKCIRIGLRKNLIYPIMFMIFVNSYRIIRSIISSYIKNDKIFILFPALMVLSNIVFGTIFLFLEKSKNNIKSTKSSIKLIHNEMKMKRLDNKYKLYLLFALDGYLELFAYLRYLYYYKLLNEVKLLIIDNKSKYREIIFASILSFLILRKKMYKHHFVSIIIIIIIIIFNLIMDFSAKFLFGYNFSIKIISVLFQLMVNICRTMSDVTEKYLYEYDFVNPYEIMQYKSIIEVFLIVFLYYYFETTREEINFLYNMNVGKLFLTIFLFIIYFIICGFLNIYRLLTIKMYSPTTKSLFDSFFDVLFFIYYTIFDDKQIIKVNSLYFWIFVFTQIIIIFFSLVYNEFIVLYCYGMEANTYLEVNKRASKVNEITELINDENTDADKSSYLYLK